MAKIVIRGKTYDLWMGLWAMERLEQKYGDLKNAMEAIRKERKVQDIIFFFTTLANNGQRRRGLPADVPEDILDSASVADLEKIVQALGETLDEAKHTEVVGGGEADDEGTDALAAAYDEKNA